MPRRYPVEFRRKVLDLIEAGKPVAEIAEQLGITAQTVYNWRRQSGLLRSSHQDGRQAGRRSSDDVRRLPGG